MLYEAATGTKPFNADSPLGTAHAIAHDQPPSLASLRPDLDPALTDAVERALHKEPHRRFATAANMATAIGVADASAAAGHDETIRLGHDQPTALLPRVAKTHAGTPIATGSRRMRIAVVAAVVILAAVIVAGWAAVKAGRKWERAPVENGSTLAVRR